MKGTWQVANMRDGRSGRVTGGHGLFARRGFTLVELVVATTIFFILVLSLSGVFARGVSGFKEAQLMTMAQNLAEFQTEDLKNLAPSVLHELVKGNDGSQAGVPAYAGYVDPNYPNANSDKYEWLYDSGKVQTDFVVDGIINLGTAADGTSFAVGSSCADPLPSLPTEAQLLLGSHVVVQIYADDPDPTVDRRYWYDFDTSSWYYMQQKPDGTWERVDTILANPAITAPYWRITLQKEAYPLFSRQLRVAEYDASAPGSYDPWDTGQLNYRTPASDAARKFAYEITVWYRQSGGETILFQSKGTIGTPFVPPAVP